ncbi:MAG: diaminopropionate ammonia-lyase [Pseudomonadota bacterium]
MTLHFPTADLGHHSADRGTGDAAHRVISADAFAAARAEITQWAGYAPTPLVSLDALAAELGVARIDYKDEGPRFGLASFKALGGAYAAQRVLQAQISARTGEAVSLASIRNGEHAAACADITLVSATDGNHGRSLAWGCQRFGAPCNIYIHAEVSEGRAEAMRRYGANVIRIDGDYDESVRLAKTEADANGWFVVSDTSWPGYSQPPLDVMSGYGVMTREACDALAEPPTHVFLQGGVGGMAAGIAAALRQFYGAASPRVVIVEPDRAACLFESAKAGTATSVAIETETIMAGLSCGEPSPLAWDILAEEASDFLTIPDDTVAPAVRLLARPLAGDPAIDAGESAVAGLAALILARRDAAVSEALGLDANARVLLFGSEGVTDPDIFARIMAGHDAL